MLSPRVEFALSSLLTALALAMDAVAVSIAAGLASGKARPRDALKMALAFGGFQAGMPLLGALLGTTVRPLVEHWAPLLAGIVLIALGAYATKNALSDEDDTAVDFFDTRVLLGLALATSIDAFAVGVSLGLARAPLASSVAIIGGVTFALSFGAVLLAERVESLVGAKAQVAGGLALGVLGARMVLGALG